MLSFEASEFAKHIDELLIKVEKEGKSIEITRQHRIIARMVPVRKRRQADIQSGLAIWNELERFSTEISAYWPQGLSAVEAVQEARQDS